MSTSVKNAEHICRACDRPSRVGLFCEACRALGIHEEITRAELDVILERVPERDWALMSKRMREINFTRVLIQIMEASRRPGDGPEGPYLGVALERARWLFSGLCARCGVDEAEQKADIEARIQVDLFKEQLGLPS